MEGCLAPPRHRLPEIAYAHSVEIRIVAAILVRHDLCRRTQMAVRTGFRISLWDFLAATIAYVEQATFDFDIYFLYFLGPRTT